MIQNYRRRNPNAGLVVLWVKLMRRKINQGTVL